MLHEIFLSLLGFPGDVIVEDGGTFRVCKSFDLLTTAEREQINRIVPLGYYYARLKAFEAFYEIKWGVQRGDPDFQFYRTAMSLGISDFLCGYVHDIADLEQLVLSEGPLPLSHLLHHLQRYLLVLPILYNVWIEIEKKHIWGCQLLDFIKSKRSGVPIVDTIIQRILLRVRIVFLKQCLAWMIYGELEDPAHEFFIQPRHLNHEHRKNNKTNQREPHQQIWPSSSTSLRTEVLNRFGHASMAMWRDDDESTPAMHAEQGSSGSRSFDWNTSYMLRLELLPESHVTARIASKIMFSGKAVKLLQTAKTSGDEFFRKPQLREIYNYLARGSSPSAPGLGSNNNNTATTAAAGMTTNSNGSGNNDNGQLRTMGSSSSSSSPPQDTTNTTNSNNNNSMPSNESLTQDFHDYFEKCGFHQGDIQRFTKAFHQILIDTSMTYELFESLIDDIHDAVSMKLWRLLRDDYGFSRYLLSMRNTFLMGKGEFYQVILDGILEQTYRPAPDFQKSDHILHWSVIRGAGKLLGLDDDALAEAFKLHVNSTSIRIIDFSVATNRSGNHHSGQGCVILAGDAVYVARGLSAFNKSLPSSAPSSSSKRTSISLCNLERIDPAG